MTTRTEYYSKPTPLPHIAWRNGWWCVKGHELPWKHRSVTDKERWDKAYQYALKLNQTPFYEDLRHKYYKTRGSRTKIDVFTGTRTETFES